MVMKMNKSDFIRELEEKLGYSEEKCIIINDVLESNFFISKKNKEKIITKLIEKLEIDEIEANKIYNTSVSIIASEIKNKLKHPFRSKD